MVDVEEVKLRQALARSTNEIMASITLPLRRQKAEQERQKLEQERQKTERLIAQLRALGVEPDLD